MKPVKGRVEWPKSLDPKARASSEVPKHRSKKDTRHWCLGREGRYHQCQWQPNDGRGYLHDKTSYPSVLSLRCTACRKEFVTSYRLSRMWPDQWGSRHDPASVPQFYGPGLPGDYTWVDLKIPEYVEIIGARR